MDFLTLIGAIYWRQILAVLAVGFVVMEIATNPLRALGYIAAIVGVFVVMCVGLVLLPKRSESE